MTMPLLAAWTLARRELVRFYRQKSRVIGVIGSPLVFWFLIGSGLGSSFRHETASGGMNYLEYFFPGTLVLILLFTAIFSTMSIIEDRQEGFLQAVVVAPIPRASIALGKILGASLLALAQALLMLVAAPFIGIHLTLWSVLVVAGVLAVVAFALAGLGFMIAWRIDSTQGFHAIMNLFLIPLWLLSGALFPPSGAAGWLRVVMTANPLTYSLDALRQGLYLGAPAQPGGGVAGLPVAALVSVLFALGTFAGSTSAVRRRNP